MHPYIALSSRTIMETLVFWLDLNEDGCHEHLLVGHLRIQVGTWHATLRSILAANDAMMNDAEVVTVGEEMPSHSDLSC